MRNKHQSITCEFFEELAACWSLERKHLRSEFASVTDETTRKQKSSGDTQCTLSFSFSPHEYEREQDEEEADIVFPHLRTALAWSQRQVMPSP